MMHGPMPISVFEQIVAENVYERFNGWGLHQLRHGRRDNDAPPETATLTFGAWDEGRWLNIPVPDIPEFSVYKGRKLMKVGWRSTLVDMVKSGYIRCGSKVEDWLGHEMVEKHNLKGVKLSAGQ